MKNPHALANTLTAYALIAENSHIDDAVDQLAFAADRFVPPNRDRGFAQPADRGDIAGAERCHRGETVEGILVQGRASLGEGR